MATLHYSMYVPKDGWPVEVSPGHMSDGTLSANLPIIQLYIATVNAMGEEARESRPPQWDKRVFALAALSVCYQWSTVAYSVFWNKKERQRTGQIVDEVYFERPSSIKSPISWLGADDMLPHLPLQLPDAFAASGSGAKAAPRKRRKAPRLTHVKRRGRPKAARNEAEPEAERNEASTPTPTNGAEDTVVVADEAGPVIPPSGSLDVVDQDPSMPPARTTEPRKPIRVSARQKQLRDGAQASAMPVSEPAPTSTVSLRESVAGDVVVGAGSGDVVAKKDERSGVTTRRRARELQERVVEAAEEQVRSEERPKRTRRKTAKAAEIEAVQPPTKKRRRN